MIVALNIILGLFGLGLVIIIHELGHFVAAKLSGIRVEAFSVGWGKVLLRKTYRGTEYRLSMLPIGGYCKMQGEEYLKQADKPQSEMKPPEAGSLFFVPPWKRLITYFAGPFANFLFSILVLSIIWFAGSSIHTFESKIILQSETMLAVDDQYPADIAGLKTGDRIVEIDGHTVESFKDIEQYITPSAGEELAIVVKRATGFADLTITPRLDPETGAGLIGVAAWVEPVIASVTAGSGAEKAGIIPGDAIKSIDGIPVRHSLDLYAALSTRPAEIDLSLERNGTTRTAEIPVIYTDDGNVNFGFAFAGITIIERERNPFTAVKRGVQETFSTLSLSIKSIALLFKGVNLRSAVSGPIRITYLVGEVATRSFSQGIGRGLLIVFRFLSMLSVALCFMNLLPIPALDGGFILVSLAEIITKKPIRPKFFYRYQIIGFAILFTILILTLFNDVFYLAGR
jgi:regulator of sigma E protease